MNPQTDVMGALATALAPYLAQSKAQTVGAPVGPYLHGPGGLFGALGLDRDVISTHIQMEQSVAAYLSVQESNERLPDYAYITGFIRSDQQEKNNVCDNPPVAGGLKTCRQTAYFGRKEFMTRQVEINRIGQIINRGEFMDLNLVNSPLVNQLGGLLTQNFALGRQQGLLAGREMLMRIVEVGVAFQRWLCPTVYTGNPANSSAGGGYREFPGLDILVARNHVDSVSGQACPSLYSDIKNFNYSNVCDPAAPNNIVNVMTYMYRILRRKAAQQNMGTVDWRIAMREPLFYEITACWPCNYLSYRCQVADGANIDPVPEFDTMDAITMRDAMRNGRYLLIDGYKVPVITDDCITEETSGDNGQVPIGGFASDIYFLPFSIRGGSYKTLYWQFFDYRNDVIPATRDGRFPFFFWSDNGRFLWSVKSPDNWCVELIAKIEPRIILKTPQLAGRIQNVVYIPLQHPDDPLPSQPYHVDGGVPTGYPPPSPYSPWNLSGPGR